MDDPGVRVRNLVAEDKRRDEESRAQLEAATAEQDEYFAEDVEPAVLDFTKALSGAGVEATTELGGVSVKHPKFDVRLYVREGRLHSRVFFKNEHGEDVITEVPSVRSWGGALIARDKLVKCLIDELERQLEVARLRTAVALRDQARLPRIVGGTEADPIE